MRPSHRAAIGFCIFTQLQPATAQTTWKVQPELEADPDTIATCTAWYDNGGLHSCEHVRESLGVSPETFSRWNPSITLDCDNWQIGWSYCTWVEEEAPEAPSSSTTSTTAATTTTAEPRESPTGWEDLGCWVYSKDDLVTLDRAYTPAGGDPAMTQSKCRDICFEADQRIAGLLGGKECWCSDFAHHGPEEDDTGCDVPCSGDEAEMCGGAAFFSVFEAKYREPWADELLDSETTSAAATPTSTDVQEDMKQDKKGGTKGDTKGDTLVDTKEDIEEEPEGDSSGAAGLRTMQLYDLLSFVSFMSRDMF